MAAEDAIPSPRGEENRDWRQGAIFRGDLAFLWNDTHEDDAERVGSHSRQIRATEYLVVISQDCDIAEAATREPYVEALICRKETNRDFLSRIDRNSARWFVIDPDGGLVAEAKYRLQIAKGLLDRLEPEPWPSGTDRLQRFVRWLARRYDRPALSDVLVDCFQRPLQEALEALDQEILAALNAAVLEIRVNMPESEDPPFELQIVYLVRRDELSENELESIQIADQAVRARLDADQIVLVDELRVLSDEEMSLAEYFATRPLFLEFLTYQGEELTGIEAPDRA